MRTSALTGPARSSGSDWNAGWALHGYASVPAQPASHGCARLPLPAAKIVYAFARIGTPVRVI
jgi:lipoprotein-anchoring transpeptidase ErfK/SrfK